MPSPLPVSTDFTGSAVTEAGAKTFMTAVRDFLSSLLGATGNQTDALQALGSPLCASSAKTGAYTVVAADRGRIIDCSGTWTLSLTAAATLGDGFVFGVRNSGSGTITLDPSGAETVDGAATKAVGAGEVKLVYGNGTNFVTIGGGTPSAATPLVAGTGAVGTAAPYAREDHVHPSETTLSANLTGSSVVVTGIPAAANYIQVLIGTFGGTDDMTNSLRVGTSAGVVSSGYIGGKSITNNTTAMRNEIDGGLSGVYTQVGVLICALFRVNGNEWGYTVTERWTGFAIVQYVGKIALASNLDRIAFERTSGPGSFSSGTMVLRCR